MYQQTVSSAYKKEIPMLRAGILKLYRELDMCFGLHAALVPIVFTPEDDKLGSYTPESEGSEEEFCFSLPFISYSSKDQLSKSDREDLYRHEYAHYMRHHMTIPKEYTYESGPHGSAWRYCCSLINAVPSPYYKVGESLKKQNYAKVLTNNWTDNLDSSRTLDRYRQTQISRAAKNSTAKFRPGDIINHPKYGEGTVEEVLETGSSVRLQIRFGSELKAIDQAWLIKAMLK